MRYIQIPLVFLEAIFLLTIWSSCKENGSVGDVNNKIQPCNLNEEFVKNVSGENGVIWYHPELKKYCIYTAVSGTYDSQIVRVVCNMPEELKKDSTVVNFSGKYFKYPEKVANSFAGQMYYNFELSEFKVVQ
ncbi:hypothetical protein [Dyadobacter sp. NIV53]|uniref:hypothetical protein n=1 Tax=Dyadobacter sp. NIV53 TaxID=2861765 RepID=UPI001C87979B|nr:hypothetical protein [Dyadobacter sp. NIV53]